MKQSTAFALMYEFGTVHIKLTELAEKYFNHNSRTAKSNAIKNKYEFPVFRSGNNGSEWLVDVNDFAEYIDKKREKAEIEFKETH